MATEQAIEVQFTAQLRKSPAKGGWSYVIWPESTAFFETRGLVKVRGTIDGHPFRSAFMAMGGGVHKLPVKAETRNLLGKKNRRRRNRAADGAGPEVMPAAVPCKRIAATKQGLKINPHSAVRCTPKRPQ
jgi:hypothetical protein